MQCRTATRCGLFINLNRAFCVASIFPVILRYIKEIYLPQLPNVHWGTKCVQDNWKVYERPIVAAGFESEDKFHCLQSQAAKKKPNNNNKLTFVLVSFLRGCQCDVTRIWCLLPLFCKKENCFFFTVIVRTYCMLLAKYKTAVVSQMSKDGKAFTARCQLHLA